MAGNSDLFCRLAGLAELPEYVLSICSDVPIVSRSGTVLSSASLRPDNFMILISRGRRSIMPTYLLTWWVLAPVAIIVVAYLAYQAAMPTPLPGIPYKTASASRLLGDLPDMLSYTAKTRNTVSFFASHCVELKSPITQIFIRPFFCKPWVIITDSRE